MSEKTADAQKLNGKDIAPPRHSGAIGATVIGAFYPIYLAVWPDAPKIPPEALIQLGVVMTVALGWAAKIATVFLSKKLNGKK